MIKIPVEMEVAQAQLVYQAIEEKISSIGDDIRKDITPIKNLHSLKERMGLLNGVADDLSWKIECALDYIKDKSQ